MNIEIKDMILLSDKGEYVVAGKINYEDKICYYIIDKDNYENIKFCYQEGNELVEILDKDLVTKLLPLFCESGKKELSDELKKYFE